MLRFESNYEFIISDVAKNLCFILYVEGNFRSYRIIIDVLPGKFNTYYKQKQIQAKYGFIIYNIRND